MAEEISRLRGTRNVYLRAMGNIEKDVVLTVSNFDSSDKCLVKLKTFRAAYEKKLVEVVELDGFILDTYKNDDSKRDDELAEILTRSDNNNAVIIKIDFYLQKATVSKIPVDVKKSNGSSVEDEVNQSAFVRLPKLELEKFDGKAQNWRTFWNRFKTSIDDKDFLSQVDKFNYFLGLLDNEAKECVNGLDLTPENYTEAKKILCDRFGNPQVIIASHMETLINLPKVKNIGDVVKLRKLYDQVKISIRNLKSLDMLPNSYGSFLIPVLNEKIPEELRVIISRRFNDKVWNLTEMIECIKSELLARERCSSTSLGDKSEKENKNDGKIFTTASFKAVTKGQCVYCRQSHGSSRCLKVTDVKARKNILRRSGRCFKCLDTGHKIASCPSTFMCRKCKVDGHHISICSEKIDPPKKPENSNTTSNSFTDSCNNILLQTAVGEVSCVGKDVYQTVRLMFDSGSQRSYITDSLRSRLKLKTIRTEKLILHTFGNTRSESREVNIVQLKIRAQGTRNHDVYIEAICIPIICAPIHNELVDLSSTINECKHLKNLALADIYDGKENLQVEILIGLDFYYCMVNNEVRNGLYGPIAVSSMFGWILCGRYGLHNSVSGANNSINMLSMEQLDKNANSSVFDVTTHVYSVPDVSSENGEEEEKISGILKSFHDVESLGLDEENKLVNDFNNDLRFNGFRYTTKLLLKEYHEFIPDNYDTAKRRLNSLYQKFKKDTELFKRYNNVICEYIQQGIVEVADDDVEPGMVHYLPHMPVVKEDRETTKVRPVFDASSKANKSEPSLNECLYSGPCLLPKIFDVLLRFRLGKIGIVADIKQAFLNIEIDVDHRDLLRFLWFDVDNGNKIYTLRFCRALFGLTCSPFILNATVKHHLKKELDSGGDPVIISKLEQDLYVDDPATSVNTIAEGMRFYDKSVEYFKNAGFVIHKWKTNDRELHTYINDEDNISSVDISYSESVFGTSNIYRKVLGINWDVTADELVFDFSSIVEKGEKFKITKRNILKIGASFYDPVGWICLIVLQVKLIFKQLCLKKVNWDDEINDVLGEEWLRFFKDLKELGEIRLARYIHRGVSCSVELYELHGFSDSSKDAYAAVVYLRAKMSDGTFQVNIVAAKSKVTPSNINSIARLELLGCLLLTKLLNNVQKAIEVEKQIDAVICWTDSRDALFWIEGFRKEWKAWIENRVVEIRKMKYSWKHVPGKLNPADLATRGDRLSKIVTDIWWFGPEFLHKDKFPDELKVDDQPSEECLKEVRGSFNSKFEERSLVLNSVVTDTDSEINYFKGIDTLMDPERYCSFYTLCVVTAYVLRFVRNIKRCIGKKVCFFSKENDVSEEKNVPERDEVSDEKDVPELLNEEIENTERIWIKVAQENFYKDGKLKQLKVSLRLYEDLFSILRSKTRLCEATKIPIEVKFPILLPSNHAVTKLIIMDAHEEVLHMATDSTLNKVRQKYWVIQGRSTVTSVVNHCSLCKLWRLRKCKATPLSNLPDYRVCSDYPFQSTGIDFAGPLLVRSNYGGLDDMFKCYILIFTCATTRGVHLELTPNMEVISLIGGIQRFLCRKGYPELVISDNGRSFKAEQLKRFLRRNQIKWKYILELSPWWGGFYERLIKIVKQSLYKICGHAKLKYDELNTILVKIEHMMNSRPLTYLSDENVEAMTPYHLMNGRNLATRGSYSYKYCGEESEGVTNRTKYVSLLINQFWNRFYQEYVTGLRERMMYDHNDRREPKLVIGDIVLIKEEKVKPLHWKKGKIEELITGRDGACRGVVLKASSTDGKPKYLRRSVLQISPLEITQSFDDDIAQEVVPDNDPDDQAVYEQSDETIIADDESVKENENSTYRTRRDAAIRGENKRRLTTIYGGECEQ